MTSSTIVNFIASSTKANDGPQYVYRLSAAVDSTDWIWTTNWLISMCVHASWMCVVIVSKWNKCRHDRFVILKNSHLPISTAGKIYLNISCLSKKQTILNRLCFLLEYVIIFLKVKKKPCNNYGLKWCIQIFPYQLLNFINQAQVENAPLGWSIIFFAAQSLDCLQTDNSPTWSFFTVKS